MPFKMKFGGSANFETAERKWVEGLMEKRIEFGSKKIITMWKYVKAMV